MMNASMFYCRMAAEGIAIAAVKRALRAVSDENRTGGFSEPGTQYTPQELFEHLRHAEAFGGGYLYSGAAVTADGQELATPVHTVRDYHITEEEQGRYEQELQEAVDAASSIDYTNALQETVQQHWVRRGDVWVLEWMYDSQEEEWENQNPLVLPKGVRRIVAERTGCSLSPTFHKAFDLAVEQLENCT